LGKQQTKHIVSAHDRRPGFDATSILPYDGAKIANMFEYYSPGAHSDVGGSQPQTERIDSKGDRIRRDDLQDINLAIMRFKAQQAGITLRPAKARDQFTLDPRTRSEQELWNDYIHDSRLYYSTYLVPETFRRIYRGALDRGNTFETYDRRERDIYFTNGSHKVFSEKELERRWRKYNAFDLVIEEKENQPSATDE
jgi:hypothetical protein